MIIQRQALVEVINSTQVFLTLRKQILSLQNELSPFYVGIAEFTTLGIYKERRFILAQGSGG
jgi:hypothetical protein